MVSVYQIGLLLVAAVVVLGSALIIAWRDARRGTGGDREASRDIGRARRRWRRRKAIRDRNRMFLN